MANKRYVNALVQGVTSFVLIFSLSFFSQKFLTADQSFQAELYTGKSSDVLNPSIQCSINDRYLLPIHGGSDSYSVYIEKPSYGNIYASDCDPKTPIDLDNLTPADSPLCFIAKPGIMGETNIIAEDKLADKSPISVAVTIGPPCVKSIELCKNVVNNACETFTDDDRTMLVGNSLSVPYAKLLLANDEELFVPSNSPQIKFLVSNQVLRSSYAPNSDAGESNLEQDKISGVVNNGIFYPSAMGNVILQVQLLNSKSFQGNTQFYSEPLLINVAGANCASTKNNIFANTRSLIVNDSDLAKLPKSAFVVYKHTLNYPFTIAGTDINGISYDILFQHDTDDDKSKYYKNEMITRVNTTTSKHYTINYTGNTVAKQIDSIMETFDIIDTNSKALILSKYDGDEIMFKSKNIGTGETGDKNIWTITTSGTAPFGNAIGLSNIINGENAVSGQGDFANVLDKLEPFPDTMNEGDLMVAYYPGSDLHGFWTVVNSVSTVNPDDKLMSIKIIPYASSVSNSGEAGQVLLLEQERLKIAESDKKEAKTALDTALTNFNKASTTLKDKSAGGNTEDWVRAKDDFDAKKEILDKAQKDYDTTVTAYTKAVQNVSVAKEKQVAETLKGSERFQTLVNYDSPFAMINAQEPGQAVVAVQGFSCSTSKKITVIPSSIEILIDEKLPTDDIVSVKVNDMLNLSARYRANGQIINETMIEWQLVDNSNGGNNQVATMLKAINETKDETKNEIKIDPKTKSTSNSTNAETKTSILKALHKGTVHVRAIINIPAVDKTPAQKLQSKVLKIEVAGGMLLNSKAYDHSVTLFPSETKKFTITGISSDTKFQWITHDMGTIGHGAIVANNYMYNNDQLIYTAPVNPQAKELVDILEVRNLDTDELIKVEIKIIPAEIAQLKIIPANADINTSLSPSAFKVKMGQALPLKLVALLEDGTKTVWQASELVSPVFGNPTWTISDETIAHITGSGQVVAEIDKAKVGFTTVEVVVGSEYKDENGKLISTKTTVDANIEVVEGFSINGIYNIEKFKDFEVPAGTSFRFEATDGGLPANVKWYLEKNQSGGNIAVISGGISAISTNNTIIGDNITYKSGVKSDTSGSIKDIIKVTDGEGNIYSLEISVIAPVLEELQLVRATPSPANVPYPILREGDILNENQLVLNYKLANQNGSSLVLGTDDIPSLLGTLTWESSDENLAVVSNGIVTLKQEGKATITVYSSLNPELKTSLTLDIEAKKAEFVPNSTKISPVFATVDALMHIETEIYFEDGIKNVQEVTISFNSPYLQSRKLKLDEVYWQEILSREGVKNTNNSENANEPNDSSPDDSSSEDTGPRQARYILDYQLPGEKALDGKTIIYTITVTTSRGVRTNDTSTTPSNVVADPSLLKNSISQVGVLTIGTAESMCTKDKRLQCLLRGLKCLREKQSGVVREECDQIISVFTNDPANFSIIDIFSKYKKLK